MKLFYRLFRQDPESREGVITMTSGLGIVVNILIAALKVLVGAATASIAIISEGVNNATDAATSVLTLVGAKLSSRRPTEKHPFGYGRIEYLTGLIIAALILFTGFELLTESVKLIFNPSPLALTEVTLVIIAVTALIKFLLGVYTIKKGKSVSSDSLTAVGIECRNDSFVSLITLLSAGIFLIFDFSVDAYAGILTSAIVLKAGFDVLKETVSNLLGKSGDHELAITLYRMIVGTEGILGAADMMLHNYGPDAYSGSVNVEIRHDENIGDIYRRIHALQLKIMHEYHVTMVFGIYAVDDKTEEARQMRRVIGSFVAEREHIKSFHALYHDQSENRIYCDFIVDYALRDYEGLEREFLAYMKEHYPEDSIELTVETEFV